MDEFNAFLMPSSFLRRWSYNELIPALLYFNRVTFVMDDIGPEYISDKAEYQQPGALPVRLRSPKELAGMDANEFVDGLSVEQHRYYWPMRDLMREEVIAITSMGLGSPRSSGDCQKLQSRIDGGDELAKEFLASASNYYDFMVKEPSELSDVEKSIEVRGWIMDALQWKRRGWEQVTLHPQGYVALLSALRLYPDLAQLNLKSKVDMSGRVRPPHAQSYLAQRVVGTLLHGELDSFTLEDDPEALSEILELRRKHASELKQLRVKLIEAANEWQLADTDLWHTPEAVENYIQTVRPAFEQTKRALSDKWRIPKLVTRKGGALLMCGAIIGIGAFIGGTAAGPIGAMAGAAVGTGVTEGLKSFFSELGKETASTVKGGDKPVDKSMVYLLHAQKVLNG